MSYFDNWGSMQNPIRQSDMNSLFGAFNCTKQFAISKLNQDKNSSKPNTKRLFGELVHEAIRSILLGGRVPNIKNPGIEESEKYQQMIDILAKDKVFLVLKKNKIFIETAFMVEVGGFWFAGSIDLITKVKGRTIIVDWKTGDLKSQYEMNNGYQTLIYKLASEKGVFFKKPDDMSSGKSYFEQFKKFEKKSQKVNARDAKVVYAYIRDFVLLLRSSVKKAQHISTMKIANPDGNLVRRKGEARGPVYYETEISKNYRERLLYNAKVAVAMARTGLFPENLTQCQQCRYEKTCTGFFSNQDIKDEVKNLIEEVGL